MKFILPILLALALITSGFAQTNQQVDRAISTLLQGTGRSSNSLGGPATSALSSGMIGLDGSLSLGTDTSGRLIVPNRTNAFHFLLSFPTPTANRTISFPIGGGTMVTTPTTLEWQFTGATYNTVLTQAEPTVGDTVINLPDTANVDTSIILSTLTTNGPSAANSIWGVSNGLAFEGATADAYETTVSPVDPTADQTWSIPNFAVNAAFVGSTLTTNNIDAANSIWLASNAVVLEGATADGFETTISPVDPTADQTISIPNVGVNSSLMFSTLTTNTIDAANAMWFASNALVMEGATANAHETTLAPEDPTADVTYQFPAAPAGTYPVAANVVETRTATADGTTTGTISAGVTHVTVTSDDANKIIILPAPVVGKVIIIDVGATGFELRSSAPDTIAINGGTGAAAESAIAANSTCWLVCVSATAWKGFYLDADSDLAKIEVAAP